MIVATSDRCQFLPSGLSIMIAILQISTSFICSMFFYFICAKQSLFDEFKPRIVKGFECSPMDYPFLVCMMACISVVGIKEVNRYVVNV